MGPLVLSMVGMLVLAPVIAKVLSPVVTPLFSAVGADPAVFPEHFCWVIISDMQQPMIRRC